MHPALLTKAGSANPSRKTRTLFRIARAATITIICLLHAHPGSCEWQWLTKVNGLAGTSVSAMLEDHSGNLWFATDGGVSRYDGVAWTTYTTADGLGSNYVSAILQDSSGNLWFGTNNGLVSSYDGVTWSTYTDGLGAYFVSSILQDHSGNIWVGTEGGGVSRFDGTNWAIYTVADGLVNNDVAAMVEDRLGNLWFGCRGRRGGGGLSRYDGTSWRTYTTSDGLADNDIEAILEDRRGSLWFANAGSGVSRFDGTSWNVYTSADGLAAGVVSNITMDRWGNLWFGIHGAGVSRYDGSTWTTYTNSDGLADNNVLSLMADHSGNIWLGMNNGVNRYDGTSWKAYTVADGLAGSEIHSITADRFGNLWFGTFGGASRFDGRVWKSYTTADGLASDNVSTVFLDRSGTYWFGTYDAGVSRYDGATWTTYTFADTIHGVAGNAIYSIMEDSSGALWFGTGGGARRFDGVTWKSYTTADGLVYDGVSSILQDRSGNIWFGTPLGESRFDGSTFQNYTSFGYISATTMDDSGALWVGTSGNGVFRFDGVAWRTFTTSDGLADNSISAITAGSSGGLWVGTTSAISVFDGTAWKTFSVANGFPNEILAPRTLAVDRSGNIWFGTPNGAYRYEPDRVPPKTVLLSRPPPLSASRDQGVTFVGAFGEAAWVEFSHRFDGGPWSPWSVVGSWAQAGISDGAHTLEARSRDYAGNLDPTPAAATFVIDATPPTPVISSPQFGQAVRGSVDVRGSATDARFHQYLIDVRPSGTAWNPISQSSAPVTDGSLGSWNTSILEDGNYDLRLSVVDSLGLVGITQVTVVVDNHAPFADETTPSRVLAASGGDVFTTNGEAHLYFPPHAFSEDAIVTIASLADSLVPDTLRSGIDRVLSGYEISWSGGTLGKQAWLEFSYAGISLAGGALALYFSRDGANWHRLGGTVENDAHRLSLSMNQPGRYALFAERNATTGEAILSAFTFTPRVFSPTGAFASSEVGISFTLGRPAPVTVRVYSRSGRLVREVVTGQAMNAGANLVRWDGRDRNGGFATDGLYLVTVEALGRTERKALAVVR